MLYCFDLLKTKPYINFGITTYCFNIHKEENGFGKAAYSTNGGHLTIHKQMISLDLIIN